MSDKSNNKLLKAQQYMYENITGFDYDKCPHLLELLGILGRYPIPKCKQQTERNE